MLILNDLFVLLFAILALVSFILYLSSASLGESLVIGR